MPYINNQGVIIHYEVEGKGPPLVLIHGLMGKLENWHDLGYTQELSKDYRLILLDARGHGASDKPVAPGSYQPKLFADDVLAVMDELKIDKAHYFGYSMAAKIGFYGIARYALPRFHSLVLGGSSPYRAEIEIKICDERISETRLMVEKGVEDYIAYLEKRDGPLSPRGKAQLLANDPRVILAFVLEYETWPGVQDTLPVINIPCLIYAGEFDPRGIGGKKGAAHMPMATFVSIPKLSHPQCWRHSEIVLPYVKKFLTEVEQKMASQRD